MRRTNNSGMSFIEMAVVVVIVGILSVAAGMNINTINAPKSMDSAKRIVTALDKARLETMSKVDKNVVAALFSEDGNYFVSIIEEGETPSGEAATAVRVGGSDMKISVNGELVTTTPIIISFDKGTGAFLDREGLFPENSAEILIEGTKSAKVILVKLTGNSYIE